MTLAVGLKSSAKATPRKTAVCAARGPDPKDRAAWLRSWFGPTDQTVHDRDTHAARNIELRGPALMASEFSVAEEKKADEAAPTRRGLVRPGPG